MVLAAERRTRLPDRIWSPCASRQTPRILEVKQRPPAVCQAVCSLSGCGFSGSGEDADESVRELSEGRALADVPVAELPVGGAGWVIRASTTAPTLERMAEALLRASAGHLDGVVRVLTGVATQSGWR